ncbi:hypothetical protein GGR57DRAFT_499486 [Xylariaceae sp. FL1272]|nr:hypothetical protein GGR57DRAFT_499486 [Xylariaceae sp. FL1272]
MAVPNQFTKQYEEVRDHFGGDGPRLKLERYLGAGTNNFTLLFIEENGEVIANYENPKSRRRKVLNRVTNTISKPFPTWRKRIQKKKEPLRRDRRVVVKRSRNIKVAPPAGVSDDFFDLVGDDGIAGGDDMVREITAMQRFTGIKDHIVKLLSVEDNEGRIRTSRTGPGGPDMAIQEYVPNGTLRRFVTAVGSNNLPASLINSIFFCFVRMAIAMAYPGQDGETVPEDPTIYPTMLAHCDMDWTNVMFGDITPSTEHDRWPILKAIDFGQARDWTEVEEEEERPRAGSQRKRRDDAYTEANDLAASALVADQLIPGRKRRNVGVEKNILDMGQVMVQILVGRNIEWTADRRRTWIADRTHYPTLNPDIRQLIIRCLAPEGQHRPSLEELVSYPWLNVETSPYERNRLLAEHMYEPPPVEPLPVEPPAPVSPQHHINVGLFDNRYWLQPALDPVTGEPFRFHGDN